MSLVAFANVICDDAFVKRFHADPRVQATELLLQERVPREAVLMEPRPAESRVALFQLPASASRRFRTPHTVSLHSHVLSNGRYSTMLTHVGGGFSMWRDLAVTRGTEDSITDAGPHYLYLRDPWSGRVWSATYLPVGAEPDSYEAMFELEKATFRRRDGDLETQVQIAVSSEDDVEVRRLSITNRGERPREIEVTSYAEIVLARPADDLAHPAFSKLFVETEFDSQSAGLLFTRRPRSSDEQPVWAFHVLGVEGRVGGAVEWETDRARFLGRGRSAERPQALDGRALSGTVGAVLDPVAALRERVRLPPGAFVRVSFATGIAPDRAAALTLARKYRDGNAAARAFSMAFTHAHTTTRHLGLSDEQAILFDRLASRVFGSDRSCISPLDLAANTLGQANLWGYGISGDLPIVLVRVAEVESLTLVRQLLRAQEYWRVNGQRTDVIILNDHPADYRDETQQALASLTQEPRWAAWRDKPGGLFLLRADGMPEADRRLLSAVARVVLEGDRGDLAAQLHRSTPWLYSEQDVPPTTRARAAAARGHAPAGADAADGQRPRRVHRRGAGVRGGARRRSRDAATVVERARQSRVRHDRDGVGLELHLGCQQPREQAHTVRQRSGCRSHRRGHLPARRGLRRGVGGDARTAAASGHGGTLAGAARGGRDALPARARRTGAGALDRGVAGRPGESGAPHADQHVGLAAAPERIRLRGVDARPTARRHAAVRGHGGR
jgi:cyclic beta-1,2-glucan synthetase